MYYVYILESSRTQFWYIGSSAEVSSRYLDHQTNRSKYTRFKGPWKLIFVRTFTDKTEALRFERYLKKLRNKEYIRRVYAEYFNNF